MSSRQDSRRRQEDGRASRRMRFGAYSFEASNLDKMFFPDADLRKGDVLDYYMAVAETMVKHMENRPLVMRRFPDGIEGHDFYQQDMPDHFPDWVQRVEVKKEGGSVTHVLCQNRATLAYLVDQACLTPHVWLSRQDKLHRPDRMLFDLDPPGDDFEPVRKAALLAREMLNDLDLPAFVQTTGSKGVHVLTPLDRSEDFEVVREFARDVSRVLAARHDDALTVEQRKNKRRGRVYLDYLRNSYGQAMVAPYALRVLPGAPAATPLEWEELEESEVGPRSHGIADIPERIAGIGDPWAAMPAHAVKLANRRERLDDLLQAVVA